MCNKKKLIFGGFIFLFIFVFIISFIFLGIYTTFVYNNIIDYFENLVLFRIGERNLIIEYIKNIIEVLMEGIPRMRDIIPIEKIQSIIVI